MEFYEAMNKNSTIHEYEADEMSAEIIEKIIFSAFKVPTNERMGEWHYIIVKDKASVSKLLEMIPRGISDQNMDMLIKDWKLGDSMSQGADGNDAVKQYRKSFEVSAIIVPLLRQNAEDTHPDTGSILNYFSTLWYSIENIFLSAKAEGYGCNLRIPLGNEEENTRKPFGLQKDYFIPCFIEIGKLKKDRQKLKEDDRKIRERIHYWNW